MSCRRGCCESQVDHWRSVAFAKDQPKRQAETKLGRDLDAYQRLRRQGLQPRGIDDCAAVEQEATDKWEVEHHHIGGKKMREDMRKLEEKAREYDQLLVGQ